MSGSNRLAACSIYGLAAIALALIGCSSLAGAPTTGVPTTQAPMTHGNRPASGSQDLYIGNILGGVPLYSTGKNPHQVGDISDKLPRVTGVWVDQTGVLYAFTDNGQNPYETIEEFESGATTPFSHWYSSITVPSSLPTRRRTSMPRERRSSTVKVNK
jgi:hypothetical protein